MARHRKKSEEGYQVVQVGKEHWQNRNGKADVLTALHEVKHLEGFSQYEIERILRQLKQGRDYVFKNERSRKEHGYVCVRYIGVTVEDALFALAKRLPSNCQTAAWFCKHRGEVLWSYTRSEAARIAGSGPRNYAGMCVAFERAHIDVKFARVEQETYPGSTAGDYVSFWPKRNISYHGVNFKEVTQMPNSTKHLQKQDKQKHEELKVVLLAAGSRSELLKTLSERTHRMEKLLIGFINKANIDGSIASARHSCLEERLNRLEGQLNDIRDGLNNVVGGDGSAKSPIVVALSQKSSHRVMVIDGLSDDKPKE